MRAIDLFGGVGGFTLGAQRSGMRVVYAANHWPFAVRAHAANHPDVHHECQDLRQADWTALPSYDVLLASPACQGHSQASQPKRRLYHDAMRATAWAVVDCAEVTRPRAIVVENVLDFRRWQLYPQWRGALEALGYTLTELEATASFHGVPQRRTRLFIVALPNARRVELRAASVELAFGPCVEWDAGDWRHITQASPNARARIARAQANHGLRCLSQHVTGHPGVGLHEPIRTITTKDQWIVVDGERYRALSVLETQRAMGFPDDFVWPAGCAARDQKKALGNAVPPAMAAAVLDAMQEAA
jgi:DNA (cytosine-5)-methyltransferase 1